MYTIMFKNSKTNKYILMGILVTSCIISKVFQLYFLPEKYSSDGKRILREAISGYRSGDKAFDFVDDVIAAIIKITGCTSYEMFSIFFGVLFSAVILLLINKYLSNIKIQEFLFILCSLFLMNIYVFSVSKEVVQLFFVMLIIFALKHDFSYNIKILLIFLILVSIGIFMRTYFFLTAALFITMLLFVNLFFEKGQKIIRFVLILAIIMIALLYILKAMRPDLYIILINVRESINANRIGSSDANTIIMDSFSSEDSPLLYGINLALNILKISFPFQLISKGLLQIIFFVYQFYFSFQIIQVIRRHLKDDKKDNRQLLICFTISYIVIASMFEPDYGSVVRHEIVFFPIWIMMLMKSNKQEAK